MSEDVYVSVSEAIDRIKRGRLLIIVDSQDRENEGDLYVPAEKVDAEKINFMTKHGRGLLCTPLSQKRVNELNLPPMSQSRSDTYGTGWMMSVDAKEETSTGISAYDRTSTIKKLISEDADLDDFTIPGHVFPLKAKAGGVLERAGHTEAAVDLASLAGLKPAGVIMEILSEGGTMARLPELEDIANELDLKIITTEDLIKYRYNRENLVKKVAEVSLPTSYGNFRAYGYKSEVGDEQHIALVKGEIEDGENVLVRVHSECLTGDTLGSLRCDCGPQKRKALEMIEEEGKGVFLYILDHEGRGIGLINKLKAMELQEKGLDTVEANDRLGFKPDLRDYGIGAQILKDIGINSMRLLTNNPRKIIGLKSFGIEIKERIPLNVECNEYNKEYLKCKKEKLEHRIIIEDK